MVECEKHITSMLTSCFMYVLESILEIEKDTPHKLELFKKSREHLDELAETLDGTFYRKRQWLDIIANWLDIKLTFIFPTIAMQSLAFGHTNTHNITIIALPEDGHCKLGVLLHC